MDSFIIRVDKALRVLCGNTASERPSPAACLDDVALTTDEKRLSSGLMRINHVGEVCAQALYEAQGTFSRDATTRKQMSHAAREEADHLAWTAQRLGELGSNISILNPIWYAGSYVLGVAAAGLGDARSLGFVVETERQVEAHLTSHLEKLPIRDAKSRVIVEQMRRDEAAHGASAKLLGATKVAWPVRQAMRVMSKVMTSIAYYI